MKTSQAAPLNFWGIDQYGTIYRDLGPHPRKALLERLGRQHADKLYRRKSGDLVHSGYVIAQLWISLYETKPF